MTDPKENNVTDLHPSDVRLRKTFRRSLRRQGFFVAAAMLLLALCANRASARQMFHFDLDSLAYLSTAVVEGDVTDAKEIHWVNALTVKVTRAYAGDFKPGDNVVVGLSAYAKAAPESPAGLATEKYAAGDHLILFLQLVTQEQWKQDGIPYWPAHSGLKLVAGGDVTGVQQIENPGPYANTVPEGDAEKYRKKVAAAVEWASNFRKEFEKKKADPVWLLEKLKERPVREKEEWGARDAIAVALCEALGATHDQAAIAKAKAMRKDRYELQVLQIASESKQDR